MKLPKFFLVLFFLIALVNSCASLKPPETPGAQPFPSYGYHPLDPLPVYYSLNNQTYNGEVDKATVLNLLPDETMRIAIGQIQLNGDIVFGPSKAGIARHSYVVILDYIKFNTTWVGVDMGVSAAGQRTAAIVTEQGKTPQTVVPVYVGVGLRLTANVTVNEGTIDLTNLFVLGAAAQAKQVSGTMVVQTLGLSGETVSTLLPMPSEINPSTIQNAILSLASIKAKMYDVKTTVYPRVVGVYNNLGGGQETINSFISSLLEKGVFLDLKDTKLQ